MMDTEEKQELNPPLSIRHRLDRLDRLLLFLEEKQCLSAKNTVKSEDLRMSLSTALEEVHHRGTLMERVALLENRVLQVDPLSLDLEKGNTSRSSSSTTAAAEKLGHESEGKGKNINEVSVVTQSCSLNSPPCMAGRSRRRRKRMPTLRFTKWLTSQVGCGC